MRVKQGDPGKSYLTGYSILVIPSVTLQLKYFLHGKDVLVMDSLLRKVKICIFDVLLKKETNIY